MMTRSQRSHGSRAKGLPIVYWGHHGLGEGSVVELEPDGIQFVGNSPAVPRALVQLVLYVPDDPVPLYVHQAVVHEVRGRTVRVTFLTMSAEARDRLAAFWSHVERGPSMTSERGPGGHRLSGGTKGARAMAHILVIDDEEPIRGLLRFMLEGAGHEVTDMPNGRPGLAAYRAKPADLVIADLSMPEMTGLDVILELTQAFLNVKVIAISGAPEREQTLDRAKLLGVRHTLQKPFSLDALVKTVDYELAH